MAQVLGRSTAVALGAVAMIALAGCGGTSGDDVAGDGTTGAPPMQGAPAPDGGLTVSEAMESDLDGPLTVRGLVIDDGGTARLCEVALKSYPPQCGDPSLEVEGVTVADLPGAQQEGDVVWVDQVSLTGEVEDGVLTVDDTTP